MEVGEVIDFTVNVQADDCLDQPQTILLKPVGLNQILRYASEKFWGRIESHFVDESTYVMSIFFCFSVQVETICSCDCENENNVERNSPECNGVIEMYKCS